MKKIFITLAFVLIAMLAFNNAATASTTFNIYLTITDNINNPPTCPDNYGGPFYVRVFIIYDGNVITEHDVYISDELTHQITWVYGQTLSPFYYYQVQFDVCRYAPPNTYSCGESFPFLNNYTLSQLTGGWSFPVTLN